MSEDSQVTITTEEDIDRLQGLIRGNSTRSTRRVLKQLEIRIVTYENRLTELYLNESIVKARIYNNSLMIKIETDYAGGKNKMNKPEQSFKEMKIAKDPHQNIPYDKFNVMTMEEGVRKLDAELNRINTEIKDLNTAIDQYKFKYDELQARLDKAAEDEKNRSKIGKTLFPTREDLIADQIAQAKVANLMLLQELSKRFSDLSAQLPGDLPVPGETYAEWLKKQEEGKIVGFPDGDRRTVNQLRIYIQLFWSHGHSIGDVERTEGEETTTVPLASLLDFDNPANTKNIEILGDLVDVYRLAAKNEKISENVKQYITDVDSVIADPTVSKGVEIRPDVAIPVSESMRADTIKYPNAVLKFGDFYVGSFEIPTLKDTITKAWKKNKSKLYAKNFEFGLPLCPNAVPSGTSTDVKEAEQEIQKSAQTIAAEEKYKEVLAQSQDYKKEEIKIDLGDLPDTAPDWVKVYVKRHRQSAWGVYVYRGNQVLGTRGTSNDDAESAFTRAASWVTFQPEDNMEEKARYWYPSLTGYQFDIGEGLYVPLNFYETIFPDDPEVESEIPKKYGRSLTAKIKKAAKTPVNEYVAYILYGKKNAVIPV